MPLRVVDDVLNVDHVGRTDDQPVTHAVVRFEYEQRTGALIRELHLRGELSAGAAQEAGIAWLLAVHITNDLAGGIDREYVSGVDPVALAAIDDDDLVLANVPRTVYYRNDSSVHVIARCAQHEVQRHFQ